MGRKKEHLGGRKRRDCKGQWCRVNIRGCCLFTYVTLIVLEFQGEVFSWINRLRVILKIKIAFSLTGFMVFIV